VTLTPVRDPKLLKRVFCLYELGRTLFHGNEIKLVYPPGAIGEFMDQLTSNYSEAIAHFGHVDFNAANIRPGQEAVKAQILADIEKDVGIKAANTKISMEIVTSSLILMAESAETWSWHGSWKSTPVALRFFAHYLPRVSDKAKLKGIFSYQGMGNMTFLHRAACKGTPEQVREFMRLAGDDLPKLLTMKDFEGETPADTAKNWNRTYGEEIDSLLRKSAGY